jgi:ubiquinone/menaquinone biosynthesis C-methylase UbiE
MTTGAIDTSYEPFSREPEYIELNRGFTADLDLRPGATVLDLACGTLILGALLLPRFRGDLRMIGLDLSRRSLLIGRDLLREAGLAEHAGMPLIEASADTVPLRTGSVDAVLMGNAIHMLPDIDRLLREIRRILRPGGQFAFNSSFWAGTFVPGTEKFYDEWLKATARWIQRRDAAERAAGRPGIRRVKGGRVAGSRRWWSPEEYAAILDRNGFEVRRKTLRTVSLSRHAFETVGSWEGFAAVLVSGYPTDIACEALQATVAEGLEAVGMSAVPRHWLEITAVARARG